MSLVFTPRLVMRPLERADLGALVSWYTDPELMRHVGEGRAFTETETEIALTRHIDDTARRGFGMMLAELRATGEPVGRVGYMEWEVDGEALLEIGWLIARDHQGQGYATEAGRALRDRGFNVWARETLISVIRPENHASIRVAEKLGGLWWRDWVTPGGAPVALYRYDRFRLHSADGDVDESR